MSALIDQISSEFRGRSSEFHRVRPQVLRSVLETFGRAVSRTVKAFGSTRIHEPGFTRQLFVDFEAERDAVPNSSRYHIEHQSELPITDNMGIVVRYRRLDLKLVFGPQLGKTGQYLCFECKYLDVNQPDTDREYVDEGVERIVCGDYAAGHPWAIMVGLERVGPLSLSAEHVDLRLKARYGVGFRSKQCIALSHVRESEHAQAGGPHRITIVHSFHLIS